MMPFGVLAITLALLIAGTALDASATYFVFLPFLLPVAQAYGWNLVWLGIIITIVVGIGRTGRLVTSAALILFLAFMALGATPETTVRIFATGLAAGILLDATVVRALLVPSLMALLGKWNWWAPKPLRRLHERIGVREGG